MISIPRILLRSALLLLPLACSHAAVPLPSPAPMAARVREVPIVRGPAHMAHVPSWQVGQLRAEPPATVADRRRAGRETAVQTRWDVTVREPDGREWIASCLAASYQTVARTRGVSAYHDPTAAACDLRKAGDEAFQLELTREGPDNDVGWLDDPSGVVTFDRADLSSDDHAVPEQFVLRHDGHVVGWFTMRRTPHLVVTPDLDPVREQAVSRAVLLALALDSQAPERLTGSVLLPPAWARAASKGRIAVAPTPKE